MRRAAARRAPSSSVSGDCGGPPDAPPNSPRLGSRCGIATRTTTPSGGEPAASVRKKCAQRRALDIALREAHQHRGLNASSSDVADDGVVVAGDVGLLYIAGFGKTDELGLYFAIFLLVLELFLFFFLRNTRAMITSDAARRHFSISVWIGSSSACASSASAGPHASYWQFIVWIRRLMLWF